MVETTTVADPSVFTSDRREITITESDLLGTHVYADVLYTGDSDIVNIMTGETPARLDKSVQEAKEFAESVTKEGKAPRIAKAQHRERAVESGSPYTASAFFHMSITGGMEWHTVFRKAWESDAYTVEHDADYESGTLTITVERA